MPGQPPRSVGLVPIGQVAADSLPWCLRGQLAVTVVVKATFALVPDAEMELVEPEPIVRQELHHGNSPARSIRAASDLAPFLPRADVLLTGHACAPAGRKVTRQVVRLAIYRDEPLLDKTLYVYGNRSKGEPEPFERIPLVYERAYGGIGWADNPLGTGSGSQGQAARPPSIEIPRRPGVTAGFGPISRVWPARRKLLGGLDRKALDAPLLELPDTFDLTYFQAAPPDQQIDHLIGDEWVVIDGMHPELESVQSCLPGARAEARVTGAPGPITFRADTLCIDADRCRCSLVWRAVIPVASEAALADLRVLVGVATRGRPIAWPEATQPLARTPGGTVLLPVAEVLDALESAATSPDPAITEIAQGGGGEEMLAERTLEITSEEPPSAPIPFAPPAAAAPTAPRPSAPIPGAPWSRVPAQRVPESPHESTLTITPREIAAMPAPALPLGQPGAPPRSVTAAAPPAPPAPPAPLAPPPGVAPAARLFHSIPRPEAGPPPARGIELPPRAGDAIPIVHRTPLAALTVPWQLRPPVESRTLVVKGTFDLVPGGPARLRDEPDLPSGDRHAGDDPARPLLYPSDFTVFKVRADVTVSGAACAAQAALRFGRPPRRLERALPARPDDPAAAPLALGPVSPSSPLRAGKLGTYDARWLATRWPWFPEDLDPAALQHAPPEQQLDAIAGDEPFELAGLHPAHPLLRGALPGLRPRGFAQRTAAAGGELREVLLRLDTVHFEPDALKLTLVWRGVLEVQDDDASDVAEIFVMLEEMAAPPASMEEVLERYQAARQPLEAVGQDPDAPLPANDAGQVASPDRNTAAVRELLAAAGVRPAANAAAAAAAGASVSAPASAPAAAPAPAPARDVRREVEARLQTGAPLADLDLAGADLSGLDLSSRSLAGIDLRGARLVGSRLAASTLTGALLAGADLTEAVLDGADLERADLTGARLERASLAGAHLTDADLSRVAAEGAVLREVHGARVRLARGSLRGARFDGAQLAWADLGGAELDGASFERAALPEARLYEARARAASFDEATLEGVRADGVSLLECSFRGVRADRSTWDKATLDGASFEGAALARASFARASGERVRFDGADLVEARFTRARLPGASLSGANLMRASLEGADLTDADLTGANLHAAETWKAKLPRARLDGAILTQTKLKERP